ncbi:MBL fold metallo-hydrolase [candidate division KSB1 bacterium]|nr:MBL fold metallo-hydrolase [candidate division KSB1 bacterium]
MNSLTLTVLGSGTCAPTKERSCAAYHLQIGSASVLMDVGFGTMRRLTESSVDYRQIDTVLISHLHPDHVSDLVPLIMALTYTPGFKREKPLHLLGPQGFKSFLFAMQSHYGKWLLDHKNFKKIITELEPDVSQSFDEWQVQPHAMDHTELSLGYRISAFDKVIAYTGDTAFSAKVLDLLDHADLALIECSFPDHHVIGKHLSPTLAGQIADKAQCRRVLLTHFYPVMEPEQAARICRTQFNGPVESAFDLMSVEI